MNKIIPFLQDNISLIKANLLISSVTVLSSLIIAKIIVFPIIKGKKKPSDFSKMKLNFLINCMKNHEKMKLSDYILLPLYSKISKKSGDEEDFEDVDNENDTVAKIKKSKKIIKKLTNDFINDESEVKTQYASQRDKIFYLLLNNIHFLKNDNTSNYNNNQINNYSNEEIENS